MRGATSLLRRRRERPRRGAADRRDEFTPSHHSITSSARAMSVGGTSAPGADAGRSGVVSGDVRMRARALLSPLLLQAIRHGASAVVPLRTTKISFCDGIPGGAIFLVTQKGSHLTAFHRMSAKFL
jgi:hypothetical protein